MYLEPIIYMYLAHFHIQIVQHEFSKNERQAFKHMRGIPPESINQARGELLSVGKVATHVIAN